MANVFDMKQDSSKPKIYIIIPNKDGFNHLCYSAASLQETSYPNYQAILVDDCSTDGSPDFVESNYPLVKVIKNNGNKGFAGAVNTGIRYSLDQDADYIAIYNSDIKVRPNWIEPAIDLFQECAHIGSVGYTEISKGREEDFNSTKHPKLEYKEVKSLPGCLFICSSSVFRDVGLFDEDYYMYGEDNDFFCRLIKAGYTIIQTNIPVWHYGQGSSGNQPFLAVWLSYRNSLRFAIKNCNVTGVFRMLLSLLNQGCNLFLSEQTDGPNRKRLRQYNVFANFLLIIGSCCWNMLHIIPTLKSRYKTNKLQVKR